MKYILENADTIIQVGGYILSGLFAFLLNYYKSSKKAQDLAGRLVNDAEAAFLKTSKQGERKVEYAIALLYDKIPAIFRPLFSRDKLKEVLQKEYEKQEAFYKLQLDKAVDFAEDAIYGSEEGRE